MHAMLAEPQLAVEEYMNAIKVIGKVCKQVAVKMIGMKLTQKNRRSRLPPTSAGVREAAGVRPATPEHRNGKALVMKVNRRKIECFT